MFGKKSVKKTTFLLDNVDKTPLYSLVSGRKTTYGGFHGNIYSRHSRGGFGGVSEPVCHCMVFAAQGQEKPARGYRDHDFPGLPETREALCS